MLIILDTNFLLIPGQFKVDIFSEIDRIIDERYELAVIDKTLYELNKIISDKYQKMKDRDAAKLALQLLDAKLVNTIETEEGYADDILTKLAGKDTIIATNDQELKKRIKAKNCNVIVLRSKSTLELI